MVGGKGAFEGLVEFELEEFSRMGFAGTSLELFLAEEADAILFVAATLLMVFPEEAMVGGNGALAAGATLFAAFDF
jgi:hypothetical protein